MSLAAGMRDATCGYRDKVQVRRYDGVMRCIVCQRQLEVAGRGRIPSVCGQRCRKRKQRSSVLPAALTGLPRWAVAAGKRPVQPCGRAASSTDRSTWSTFDLVVGRPHGIMLGDGLACWDLDDVIDDAGGLHGDALEVLGSVSDPLWVERSMSGRGLHVFVQGDQPSFQRERVSFYSWGRFIVVTGDRFWPAEVTRRVR